MPIIAESPPLIFGATPPGEPLPEPTVPEKPYIVPISPGACNLPDLLANHKIFIQHVDMLGACFKREAMPEFTDQNFDIHVNIAIVDKYLTKNDNMYCSMQAVQNLSQKLKRFQDQ